MYPQYSQILIDIDKRNADFLQGKSVMNLLQFWQQNIRALKCPGV